jgi:hypothetical protein
LAATPVLPLVVIEASLFILYPVPTAVLGHFQQIQDNWLIGLITGLSTRLDRTGSAMDLA